MLVRPYRDDDAEALWTILAPILRAGETYALPRDWGRAAALEYWCGGDHRVFVAEAGGAVLGSYYLHANQRGGGAHVANCGYITSGTASGRGVARALCAHSLQLAAQSGFRAMQFNFVVSSNRRAVALWKSFGFETVGVLPEAFAHPTLGLVDVLVMYRRL